MNVLESKYNILDLNLCDINNQFVTKIYEGLDRRVMPISKTT